MSDPVTWVGRSPDHLWTRGAEVKRTPSGWFLIWHEGGHQKARGPLMMEAAMDEWVAIRARLAKAAA